MNSLDSDHSPALSVSLRSSTGLFHRRQFSDLKSMFVSSVKDGYVWMDFISIPQTCTCHDDEDYAKVIAMQQRAIGCIPAYVARTNNFWVCAPSGVQHEDGTVGDFGSWSSRGWCRMEETCFALANRGDGRPLMVTQPYGQRPRVRVLDSMDRLTVHAQRHSAVLTGRYTCCERGHVLTTADGHRVRTPCDKTALGPLLRSMYESQLMALQAAFAAPIETEFWEVLRPSVAENGPFFKHLLLRMARMQLLADSTDEVTEGQRPHGAEGMGPFYSKPLGDLTEIDLEEYLRTWGCTNVTVQREELPVLALREGHLTLLRYMVETCGMTLRIGPSPIGLTALMEASRTGMAQMVSYLIDRYGVDALEINRQTSSSGCCALSDAAMRGHLSIVDLLLAHGANVQARRTDGKTALHCAAENGYTHVVELLLRAGSSPHTEDRCGKTALELCELWDNKTRSLLARAEVQSTNVPTMVSGHHPRVQIVSPASNRSSRLDEFGTDLTVNPLQSLPLLATTRGSGGMRRTLSSLLDETVNVSAAPELSSPRDVEKDDGKSQSTCDMDRQLRSLADTDHP